MRILVVGGAGYVGSHCLQKLLATHHDAWAYDNLSQGHREAVPEGRLIIGDLLDTDLLIKTMKTHGIDVVLHFAAKALVGESVVRPDMYYKTNVTGTLSLLAAMVAADVKKIVFSSIRLHGVLVLAE